MEIEREMGISDDFLSAGEEEEELYPATETVAGRRADRKRRFSEEQIKSLETIFESQAKLEPCKKLQLARELGLQPRQVAIWFQNKRARWKSKQLERQYEALRADYDVLLSSFATLKKEKHILVKQVQKLAELLKRPCGESSNCGDLVDKIGKGKENIEEDEQPVYLLREEEDIKLKYACSQEETDLLNCWGEPAGTSSYFVNSAAQRSCFDNGGSSPEKSCTATPPKWWEFWPISD